jgi:hypothetical protein
MTLRLKPPVAIWKSMRELATWCRETLLEGSVATENLDDNSVTLAKLAQVATDTLLGRSTAGTGNVETITCTAAGRALLDDAAASNQRTTLGLGTAATQNTGTSGSNVPLLNSANVHGSAQCTAFSVGTATPVTTQAANADTSGATLGQLETEVNELKAVMRTFGLIAT